MQNMSFMLTKEPMRQKSKDVTRRTGWTRLKPGQILRAVEKCMGLQAGEKVSPLGLIKIVSVRREPLRQMIDDPIYGRAECKREGFGDHPTLCEPDAFVQFFCKSHKGCSPESLVTRIEFVHV